MSPLKLWMFIDGGNWLPLAIQYTIQFFFVSLFVHMTTKMPSSACLSVAWMWISLAKQNFVANMRSQMVQSRWPLKLFVYIFGLPWDILKYLNLNTYLILGLISAVNLHRRWYMMYWNYMRKVDAGNMAMLCCSKINSQLLAISDFIVIEKCIICDISFRCKYECYHFKVAIGKATRLENH